MKERNWLWKSKHQTRINLVFAIKTALVISLLLLLIIFGLTNIQWIQNFQGYQDFGSFYESSKAFLEGMNPYLDEYENVYRPIINDRVFPSPNLNPPFFLLFSRLFLLFSIDTNYFVWQAVSVLLLVLSMSILLNNENLKRENLLKFFIVLSFAGIWHTIKLGQIYLPLLLLITLTYFYIQKNKFLIAGIPLGLICAIKPNFVLIIFFILITKNYKTFLSAFITCTLAYLAPLLLFGWKPYSQWLEAVRTYQGYIITGNSSVVGLFSRFNLDSIGYISSFALIFGAIILILKQKPNIFQIITLGILISLLSSPITWSGYTILLIPYFLTFDWRLHHWIAGLCLTLPITIMYSIVTTFPQTIGVFGWIYGYAMLILLFGLSLEIAQHKKIENVNI